MRYNKFLRFILMALIVAVVMFSYRYDLMSLFCKLVCKDITWNEIVMTTEKFQGRYVKISGEVSKVLKSDDFFLLNVQEEHTGFGKLAAIILPRDKHRINTSDIVKLYGKFRGIDEKIGLPLMWVYHCEKEGNEVE